MKKRILLLALAFVMLTFTACKKDGYSTNCDAVYISKNNKVTGVTFYELSDFGNIDTFNIIDDNRMTEYNYSVNGISVSRKKSDVVGDRIKLITNYNNFLAYDGYNGVSFMAGTVEESLIGFDYEGRYIDASTEEEVSADSITSQKKLHVVIIKQNIRVYVDGDILYYSDNVKLLGKGHAETTQDSLCYIIFK